MASRFFRNTGNTNWSVTTNWSATSGGGSVGAIPTSADDVFFDANSGACTVDVTGRVALSINFTGYTQTITMSNTITVSGNVTFNSGVIIAGSSAFIINAASTITSNGKSVPNLTISAAVTITLADALNGTTLVLGAAETWAGPFGWNFTTVNVTSTGNHTLKASTTYTAGAFNSIGVTGVIHATVKSDTGGTKANLNITGLVNVGYTDFTDINASGRPIYTFSGVVSNCTNITSITDYIENPIESSFF